MHLKQLKLQQMQHNSASSPLPQTQPFFVYLEVTNGKEKHLRAILRNNKLSTAQDSHQLT